MWLTHSIFDKIHHIFCIATETETDKWWNTTLKYDELSLRAPTPQQHSLKLQWKWSSGACFPALHEGVTCTGESTKGYISKSNDTETGTAKADWELLGCQLQSFRRCFPRRQRAGKEWRTSVIHCHSMQRPSLLPVSQKQTCLTNNTNSPFHYSVEQCKWTAQPAKSVVCFRSVPWWGKFLPGAPEQISNTLLRQSAGTVLIKPCWNWLMCYSETSALDTEK